MSLNIRIHIAILVCDTPIQPILRKYGDYFAMFQELLEQGFKDLYSSEAEPHEVTVEFSKYQIVDSNQFPDLGNVDAVLLTGSNARPTHAMSNQIRTICPSTLSVIFDEPGTSLKEAVKVAADSKKAFESYRTTSLEDRKQIVRRALDIFEQRRDELAKELTAQMGRPIRYCASEINTMRLRAEYLMDIAEESLCDLPGRPESGFRRTVKRVPVGPVLIVGAWNYPYLTTVNAIVPALLAGNSVILRPSPQTPLFGKGLFDIFAEAGLPAQVLQVIQIGDLGILDQVAQIPDIQSVSFTGSTTGGIRLREATARHIKPVNLELGGNDPAYVRLDADVKHVAEQLVDGAIFNSGQSCCSIERVYVHEKIYEDFVRAVQEELNSYKLGDPLDQSTTTGPVISAQAVEKINSHIKDALAKGAVDSTPQNASFGVDRNPQTQNGNFVAPVVLTNVNHTMATMKEETFGPVMPIMKVSSDDEAIAFMNDSDYGLTASVWTKDIARGEELIDRIDAGTVFINRCDYPSPDLAWTGWKTSGLGCTLGPRGYDGFVKLKSYHVKDALV
ncbi:Aldehyde/histidinol dehydrogenase [Penicillium sp. IBT 31633x]|nr:Aldehyde/histidinol dehydrogenase [Penicillium sp. IBT 31633x]